MKFSRKQVSHAGAGNCFPQYSVGCKMTYPCLGYLLMEAKFLSSFIRLLFSWIFFNKSPYRSTGIGGPCRYKSYIDFILPNAHCHYNKKDTAQTISRPFQIYYGKFQGSIHVRPVFTPSLWCQNQYFLWVRYQMTVMSEIWFYRKRKHRPNRAFGRYQLDIFTNVLYLMINNTNTDFAPRLGANET